MSSFFKSSKTPKSNLRQTYDAANTASTTHDMVTHETPSVSMFGQLYDYASKLAVSSRLPFFTPNAISQPIENVRAKSASIVDSVFTPQSHLDTKEAFHHANFMYQEKLSQMETYSNMPQWQKREMGPKYLEGLSNLQDSMFKYKDEMHHQQNLLNQSSMNFGRPWKK